MRRVPEQFTVGLGRHDAAKAWLDGYDTAKGEPSAPLASPATRSEENAEGLPVSHSVSAKNQPPERHQPATRRAPVTEDAKCADCGHRFDLHPGGIDCAADDGFDNCGCACFIADVDVRVPLSTLFALRADIDEAINCRKVKAAGCDCRVGGVTARAMVEQLLNEAPRCGEA